MLSRNPVPPLLPILIGACILGSGIHAAVSPGAGLQGIQDDGQAIRDNAQAMQVDDGAETYATRCLACHQANGGGVPGVFPPLVDTDWVVGDKGVLIRIVLNGVTGEMEVNGQVYTGAMPPWGSFLNDEEMAGLLTYIRTSWGNEAPPVTPEEVGRVREAAQERKEPWNAAELLDETNQGIPEPKPTNVRDDAPGSNDTVPPPPDHSSNPRSGPSPSEPTPGSTR